MDELAHYPIDSALLLYLGWFFFKVFIGLLLVIAGVIGMVKYRKDAQWRSRYLAFINPQTGNGFIHLVLLGLLELWIRFGDVRHTLAEGRIQIDYGHLNADWVIFFILLLLFGWPFCRHKFPHHFQRKARQSDNELAHSVLNSSRKS
jgi:hypothetical protein